METLERTDAPAVELTRKERDEFNALAERFNMDIDLNRVTEDIIACFRLNDALSTMDLQAGRVIELRRARDDLLAEFLENPRDTYVAEVLNYARLCEKRSITTRNPSGAVTTEFVTSDHATQRADMHFWISETNDGTVFIRTEVPLKGDLYENAEPFFISADTRGGFSVEQRIWQHGRPEYIPMTLEKGGLGEDRLKRFFMFSTEAVHLAYTRQPEEQAAADKAARRLLRDSKLTTI